MTKVFNKFNEVLCAIGMDQLVHPVFYNAPIGLRFEISGTEEPYLEDKFAEESTINPKYIQAGLERVKALYSELPAIPDILRIDVYPDNSNSEKLIQSICNLLELPMPMEEVLNEVSFDDDEPIEQIQLYWNLEKARLNTDQLFEEIIKADLGGCPQLASSVFLLDSCNGSLFCLYDDRGLDIVAAEKSVLYPIYRKYNKWILDYDREKIDATFSEGI